MSTTTSPPPLARFRSIGAYRHVTDTGQPAGTCWHCGIGIGVVVAAVDDRTGERITVGTTCAERIGLDADALREHLAGMYAAERHQAAVDAAAARLGRRLEWAEQVEAIATAEHGEHGTETRYLSGCRCEPCAEVAPHGTADRFDDGACICGPCLDWATSNGYDVIDDPGFGPLTLVDVATGETIDDARLVSTRYGSRWRSDDRDVWLPFRPARRATLANKGYVEAEVPQLVRRYRNGGFGIVCPLGSPIADRWGVAIARP